MATHEAPKEAPTTPWTNASGWEYDLLRSLPPGDAWVVWSTARARGKEHLIRSWFVPLFYLFLMPFAVLGVAAWKVATALGLDWVSSFLVEVLMHLVLFGVLQRVISSLLPRLLRPFVREELLRVVERNASPDPQSEGEESSGPGAASPFNAPGSH